MISVSLKKLDPIRVPFGKPSIGLEKVQVHIEDGKVHIDSGKVRIDPKVVHIRNEIAELELNQPTVEHITKLFLQFGTEIVFGRRDVCKVTELKERGASKLIGLMLRNRLLDTVVGQGKGKYWFRDFTKEVRG